MPRKARITSYNVCYTKLLRLKLRIERVMKRDGVTEQEVMNRVNSQLVDDKKIDLADFVIHCDEKQLVLPQILAIIKHLEE